MLELARRFHWPLLLLDLALAAAVAVLALFIDGEPAWVAPVLMAVLGVLNALIAKTDRDFAREVNAAAYELGQIAPGADITRIAEAVAALLAAPPYAVVASSDAVAQALIDEPALYARLRPQPTPTPVVVAPPTEERR
jgi:hypothetical protein